MSLWILDTDHVTLFQHGHLAISRRVQSVAPESLATTIVTAEEQLRGRLNLVRRANSEASLVVAYSGLQDTLAFFKGIAILNFSSDAHTCYQTLVEGKIRIGTRDLRIAAIALATHATVVTRNQRDFSQVPGLLLADWSG
jgi:tRNA(fMet)-specific endonuclease VapC